jgi:predicted porin
VVFLEKSVALLHFVVVRLPRAMTSDFVLLNLNSVKGNIMIKKILPAMIGASLLGGVNVAVADVTAFGHIDTSFGSRKDERLVNDDRLNNLTCTTCSIGFKGSEDLGNGLKAIFKIDFQYDTTERNKVNGNRSAAVTGVTTAVNPTTGTPVGVVGVANGNSTGSGAFTDRDQWLGLDSGIGKFRVGTISTMYKSHGAMIDPVYRTAQQGRDWGLQSALQRGAGDSGQGRATNTIRYDSPTFAGFTVGGHYTVQNETNADPDGDSPWGIGGHWKGGGFLVFADWITGDSDAVSKDDAWKVGGRFGFDKFAIFGQYEGDRGLITRQTYGADGDGADVWFIGGTAGFGNNLLYAAYGQGKDSDGVDADTAYDSWNIIGTHSLSKRTKAYLGFVEQNYDDLGKVNEWSLGMKHTF